MNKKKRLLVKWVFLVVIPFVVLVPYFRKPYLSEDVGDAQSNLISASGILAGILIAFLSTKLIQFAEERNKARLMLNEYADKLTQFRKLLYLLLKAQNFWTLKKDVNRFKEEEPEATFYTLHGDGEKSETVRQKFWLSEPKNPVSQSTVDLYLAMEEIVADKNHNSFWIYDASTLYEYDLDYLERAQMPSNQIWYYLEGRYPKHGLNRFDDSRFSSFELEDLNPLAASIDSKFSKRNFDRALIAEIGTHFYENVLPEMIRLTRKRAQRLTRSVSSLFLSLTCVLVGGVIFPLMMKIFQLENEKLLTVVCVLVVIISLILFLIDLIGLALNDEESILAKERTRIG